MSGLLDQLACHGFRELFVEHLGWDHASLRKSFEVDGLPIELEAVAQKRGFPVLHCPTGFLTITNRGRLRRLQRKVAAIAHEHILIFSAEQPRRQVWQWAVCRDDGRRLRHREHPFFSHAPPARFLARLEKLRFHLDEEESIGLLDALARVREVLDSEAELKLFAKRPWYAEQSDRLFQRMRAGGAAERNDFVLFHRPLAEWVAKHYHRQYRHDEDDAQQLCMIGLVKAARLFDTSKGFQFSTYAVHCMRRTMQRHREQSLLIRLPVHVWTPCFRVRHALERSFVVGGPAEERHRLNRLTDHEPGLSDMWRGFQTAHNVHRLHEPREGNYREACGRQESNQHPLDQIVEREWHSRILQAFSHLNEGDAKAAYLYFGLDGQERTLDDVGRVMNVTRERVRQRISRSIKRLRRALRSEIFAYFGIWLPTEDDDEVPQQPQKPEAVPAVALT